MWAFRVQNYLMAIPLSHSCIFFASFTLRPVLLFSVNVVTESFRRGSYLMQRRRHRIKLTFRLWNLRGTVGVRPLKGWVTPLIIPSQDVPLHYICALLPPLIFKPTRFHYRSIIAVQNSLPCPLPLASANVLSTVCSGNICVSLNFLRASHVVAVEDKGLGPWRILFRDSLAHL